MLELLALPLGVVTLPEALTDPDALGVVVPVVVGGGVAVVVVEAVLDGGVVTVVLEVDAGRSQPAAAAASATMAKAGISLFMRAPIGNCGSAACPLRAMKPLQ